jgi:hypothetical protein
MKGGRLALLACFCLLAMGLSACSADTPSTDQTPRPPGDSEGVLSGTVTIGPLCPVEPCDQPVGDLYSSRSLLLEREDGRVSKLPLDANGKFRAVLPIGRYAIDLTECEFLGCPTALPLTVVIEPGETTTVDIDIDTGVRSPVQTGNVFIPAEIDRLVRGLIATRLNAGISELALVNSEQAVFPSTALGCPEPGKSYAQVIVPGYTLVYEHEGLRYVYHVSADGSAHTDCRGVQKEAVPFHIAEEAVTVTDAFKLAGDGPFGLRREVALRTLAEAKAFQNEYGDSVRLSLDAVDWGTQMLAGTVVLGSGCDFSVWVREVTAHHLEKDVIIDVRSTKVGGCKKAWAQPVWLVFENSGLTYATDFRLESESR